MRYWIKENGKWFVVSKEIFDNYSGKKVACPASYSNTTDAMLDELCEV